MIYTIGYAARDISSFISTLNKFKIKFLIDVRSLPYSAYSPEYNRENLTEVLEKNNLKYVYMGDLLGPRSKNSLHYKEDGQIDFELLAESEEFKKGIERLKKADSFNVAIMCAEKAPEVCHRFLLIGRNAVKEGMKISSILFDGTIETFQETQIRMMEENKWKPDFFTTKEEMMEMILDDYIDKYAYRKK